MWLDMMLSCEINLAAIRRNLAAMPFNKILMLKADAYGHGIKEVALATRELTDGFGVVTLEEAETLRQCGIKKDILATALLPEELCKAAELDVTIGLNSFAQLEALLRLPGRKRAKFHIKLDTGMHRLGFAENDIDCLIGAFKDAGISPEGVYSHLRALSYDQVAAFKRGCEKLTAAFGEIKMHIASSHSMNIKTLRYDAVRVGLAAYKGAMSVFSKVLAVRRANAGECVGYGCNRLAHATNIATIFGGYADGIDREHPSDVYIRGVRCRSVGKACMDTFMADVGSLEPNVGEQVMLLSPEILEECAKQRKTIDYTMLTCWRGRVQRIYVDE